MRLEAALADVAGVFGDEMTADHVGTYFTCSEADIIAELLITAGHRDAAVVWLTGHAFGDEPESEDLHIDDAGQPLDMVAYVAALAE